MRMQSKQVLSRSTIMQSKKCSTGLAGPCKMNAKSPPRIGAIWAGPKWGPKIRRKRQAKPMG